MKNKRGFLLIEVLIGSMVLIISGCALLHATYYALTSIEMSRQSGVALNHARLISERIRGTAFNSLASTFVEGESTSYESIIGTYTLNSERVAISYPARQNQQDYCDTCSEIVVQVKWDDRGNERSIGISTIRSSMVGG